MNPWLILAAIGLAAGAFLAGVKVEADHRDAQMLVQERAMHQAYVSQVAEYRAKSQQIAKELNDESTKRQGDAVSFREQLRRARASGKALARCQDPGQPAGAGVRLTGEFVGLYDRALEIGVPRPRDPERVDAPAPRPDSIDPADVLANHGENAEAWAECRSALRGWQALARRYGWAQ